MLTQKRLKELLSYNSEAGEFLWVESRGSNALAGTVAGGVMDTGYIRINVDGKRYRAHRLAWLYMTGEWPPNGIDHRNGVKTDNRFENLRLADQFENMQNLSAERKNNSSGFAGVSFHKQRQQWSARICNGSGRINLGLFDTAEDAGAAY